MEDMYLWFFVTQNWQQTWKNSKFCCSPAWQSFSSVLILPCRKKLFTLFPFCWASAKV
jgi:hypothetical protein